MQKYVASVSFGKDSVAMLLLLLEKGYPLDMVISVDTGYDYDAVYNVKNQVLEMIKGFNIEFVGIDISSQFTYYMLNHEYTSKGGESRCGYGWCGVTRWGTRLKIEAMNKYYKLNNIQPIEYIGIAYDEPKRVRDKVYPLVDWHMTEADCLSYCASKGIKWIEDGIDLYEHQNRVSCWCCQNLSIGALKYMYYKNPKYWERMKNLEKEIGKPFGRRHMCLADYERRFENEAYKPVKDDVFSVLM